MRIGTVLELSCSKWEFSLCWRSRNSYFAQSIYIYLIINLTVWTQQNKTLRQHLHPHLSKRHAKKLKNLKPLFKLPSSTSSQSGKRNPSFTHLLKHTNPTSLSRWKHGYLDRRYLWLRIFPTRVGLYCQSAWPNRTERGRGHHPRQVCSSLWRKAWVQTNCENLWVQINLTGARPVLIGAYYKPQEHDQLSFEEFNKSLAMVQQTNSQIWLLWDFNLPQVDWELMAPKPDCSHSTFYRECLEAFNDCLLEQMVTSPTRGQNILDLFLTSNPTLTVKVSVLPGLSDHDIVIAEVNAKPTVMKLVPRNILLYKKADWHQLKESMREFHKIILSDLATADIQVLWDEFVNRLQQGIDTWIPVRKAGSRNGLLWVNQEIRRLIRGRDKHYKHWTRSGRPFDQKKILDYKHLVCRVSERAYEKYIGDILGLKRYTGLEPRNWWPWHTSKGQHQKTILPA